MSNIVEQFRAHKPSLGEKRHHSEYNGPYVDLCIQVSFNFV
jgi:hypothetical protein